MSVMKVCQLSRTAHGQKNRLIVARNKTLRIIVLDELALVKLETLAHGLKDNGVSLIS